MAWSEDKKGQDQISESTLNKVNLPANSCGKQMFIEACYRRNLYQILKLKCSSVKTIHTNDQYQLLTNCPVHFAFTWLTGHKQQAPNLFWHCCHARLMCHFALTGCTSQSQHIPGNCRSDREVGVDRGHVKLTSWFQCTVILSSPIEVYTVITVKTDHSLLAHHCHVLFMLNVLYFPPIHSWHNSFHKALGKWLQARRAGLSLTCVLTLSSAASFSFK